jgi:hypothetical protein
MFSCLEAFFTDICYMITLIDWFTENQMKANPDKFQEIANGKKKKK